MSFNMEYANETKQLRENLNQVKKKILVMSGKGGVGKSTVSVNLAGFLALDGHETGILDIDLHGPSIPKMLGLSKRQLLVNGEKLVPVTYTSNLKALSVGFLLQNEHDSVVVRGPKKHSMVRQFLKDVDWGALDYLVIDSPPGTGDEQLSMIQSVDDLTGAVIVTTPQDVALIDVRKSINFCRKMNLPIIGIVENMSGLICPHCNKKIDIFKSKGGEKLAEEESIPFLGKLSIDPSVAESCDDGELAVRVSSKLAQEEMQTVFNNIIKEVDCENSNNCN